MGEEFTATIDGHQVRVIPIHAHGQAIGAIYNGSPRSLTKGHGNGRANAELVCKAASPTVARATNDHGWICPECSERDELNVTFTGDAKLIQIDNHAEDFSTEDAGDHIWDQDSPMRCLACGHAGKVVDFVIAANNAARLATSVKGLRK